MTETCCVAGCVQTKEDITYFKFPNSRTLRRKWLEAFSTSSKVSLDSVVCSQHFAEQEYEIVRGKRRLKAKVVPSVFHFNKKDSPQKEKIQDTDAPNGKIQSTASINVDAIDKNKTLPQSCNTLENGQETEGKSNSGLNVCDMVKSTQPNVLTIDAEDNKDIEEIITNYHIKQIRPLHRDTENRQTKIKQIANAMVEINVPGMMANRAVGKGGIGGARKIVENGEKESGETGKEESEADKNGDGESQKNGIGGPVKNGSREPGKNGRQIDSEEKKNSGNAEEQEDGGEEKDKRRSRDGRKSRIREGGRSESRELGKGSRNLENRSSGVTEKKSSEVREESASKETGKIGSREIEKSRVGAIEKNASGGTGKSGSGSGVIVNEVIDLDDDEEPVFIEVTVGTDGTVQEAGSQDCVMVLESVECEVDPSSLIPPDPDPDPDPAPECDVIDLKEPKYDPISLLTSSDEDEVIIQEPKYDLIEVSDELDEDDVPLVRLAHKTPTSFLDSVILQCQGRPEAERIPKIKWGDVYYHDCKVCPYRTECEQEYREHVREHSTAVQVCELCNYVTSSKQQFVRHRRKHREERKFKCHLCNYKAKHKMSLAYHMKSHDKVRLVRSGAFKCRKCKYQTNVKRNLVKHVALCEKVKFVCDKCSYKTGRRSDMTRHVRRHKAHGDDDDDYVPPKSA